MIDGPILTLVRNSGLDDINHLARSLVSQFVAMVTD